MEYNPFLDYSLSLFSWISTNGKPTQVQWTNYISFQVQFPRGYKLAQMWSWGSVEYERALLAVIQLWTQWHIQWLLWHTGNSLSDGPRTWYLACKLSLAGSSPVLGSEWPPVPAAAEAREPRGAIAVYSVCCHHCKASQATQRLYKMLRSASAADGQMHFQGLSKLQGDNNISLEMPGFMWYWPERSCYRQTM